MKKKYNVTGMSCAACAAHVSNAVNKLDGLSCEVSLLTNTMDVVSDNEIDDDKVINAVKSAGYGASIYENDYLKKQEKTVNKKKITLIASIIILLVLMYVAMADMLHIPLPPFLDHDGPSLLANAYTQLGLALIIIILNFHYFTSGYNKLFRLRPNMDSLVALGSTASFVYACVSLVLIQYNYSLGNIDVAMNYMHALYFDSSAMILTLVSVGKYLEGLSKKQTTKALDLLMEMVPKNVLKYDGTSSVAAPIDSIQIGEIIEVRPFDLIPLDGEVIKGESNIDESSLTGESLFVHKKEHDSVMSGSKNQEGTLFIRVSKTSENSTMNEIIKMVESASSSKMRIEKIVDKVALWFVPIVILLALITLSVWLIIGKEFTFALKMFISVLVISCPCALGLATPLCVMVSTLKASKNHILVKEAEIFEKMRGIDTIMLDKTGTITKGKMQVVESTLDFNANKILASLENKSNHPLAKVVLNGYEGELLEVNDYQTEPGRGISGIIEKTKYYAGNDAYLKQFHENITEIKTVGSIIHLFSEKEYFGYVVMTDTIKPSAVKAINLFKKHNIKIIMLTGDNELTANDIASRIGIDDVKAHLLPVDKANIVQQYEKQGHRVMMIGDGINDSVALESASVGVAMNETNIARSSADIVLTRSSLLDAYNAYHIALRTVRNIKINLFWAFFYNAITIPIAAGVFYYALNWQLSPMIAAICMSLSSVCVCLNALRLNLIKMEQEELAMKFFVKDMMCNHCVAHVKEALNVEGVNGVSINLDTKEVEVDTSLDKKVIFDLVSKAGYQPSEE